MNKISFGGCMVVLVATVAFWPIGIADLFWYAISNSQLTNLNWATNKVLQLWVPAWVVIGIVVVVNI